MKMFFKIVLLSLVSLLFVACAKKPTPNNIISDTSMLKPSPLKEGAYYYLKKGVDFKSYNKIIISDIPVIKDNPEDVAFDENLLNSISIYFRSELMSELNSVVNKNMGKSSLKFDVSVTSLGKEFKSLKFYQYIPVGLAITAITRTTGIEDKNLVIAIALKVTDSKTNEVLAMVVDSNVKKGFSKNQEIIFEDIKPTLDEWVEHYKTRMQELIDNKHNNL